jgi:hypothetical protein
MKTYQEFISEAKKCWPGYKKKGTQKLFGKSYNRCVKEDIVSFAKRQEKKGKGTGPKPTKTPKELIDLAKKLENKKEYELEERYEERPINKMIKKAMSIVDNPKYEGSSGDVWRHTQIIRHTTKNKGGGKQRKKAQHNIDKYWNKLDKEDELEEGKVPWDDPKHPLESGWTPAEKNRAKRARTGVEDPDTPQHKISDKDMTRYGSMKDADDTETEKAPKGKKTLFGKKPPEHKNLHKFKKLPFRDDKGEEQTVGNVRRSRGTPKPEATDEKSNMYQSPIKKGDKRTRGGRLDQWKGTNPRNEEVEYELEESSTGESSGKRTRGKVTLARGRGADMDRKERTTAAISKKAGLKGTGKYSTKDLRSKAKDYTTYDSEDTDDDYGSTEQDHFIRSYDSPRRAAKGERLVSKFKPSGRRTATGMTKLKTAPSSESVRRVKDLKKQMSKSGANKKGSVHTVDIMHRDSNLGKGDRSQQIERGRNFIQAIKDTPKHLKKAGAKKGDTVIGKPTAVMPGEDKKTGEAKRAKLYKRIFNSRSTKKSNVTGLMTGKLE